MPLPPFPELTVVHRSARFVVIDKPEGMLSVPGKGPDKRDSVSVRVGALFPEASGPITVHRLDMDTSGLIVCALDADAQRHLSRQFEQRHVEKRYIALVHGVVEMESGTVDVPIRPDISNRPYQIVDRTLDRPARTAWKVVAIRDGRTRLELIPLTGKTHQLRVHCAYAGPGGLRGPTGNPSGIGHPIVGDVLYGPAGDDAPRLMLHADALGFTDPATGERVRFRSAARF